MDTPTNVILNTFVVRLWRDGASGEWRGQVTHIQSHETRYFSSPEQIEAFMSRYAPGFKSTQSPTDEV